MKDCVIALVSADCEQFRKFERSIFPSVRNTVRYSRCVCYPSVEELITHENCVAAVILDFPKRFEETGYLGTVELRKSFPNAKIIGREKRGFLFKECSHLYRGLHCILPVNIKREDMITMITDLLKNEDS